MSDLFESSTDPAQVQAALEQFLAVGTLEEMQELVDLYPFMREMAFDNSVQRLIEHAIRVGEPEAVLRMQEQMDLLNRALRASHASPVERAVEDFLYAFDDEEATEIFHAQAELLRLPAAAKILFDVESGDPESAILLESRQALWQRLTGRVGD